MSAHTSVAWRLSILGLLNIIYFMVAELFESLIIKILYDESGASPREVRDLVGVFEPSPRFGEFVVFCLIFLPFLCCVLVEKTAWLRINCMASQLFSLLVALTTFCFLVAIHALLSLPYILVLRSNGIGGGYGCIVGTISWLGIEIHSAYKERNLH